MAITGYTFDKAKVTPDKEALLYDFFNFKKSSVLKGFYDDFDAEVNGLNITLKKGRAIICGRYVENDDDFTLVVPPNYSGFLCISIDLDKTNDVAGTPHTSSYTVTFNQISINLMSSLTKENLINGGKRYDFALYSVMSDASNVTLTKQVESFLETPTLPGATWEFSSSPYNKRVANGNYSHTIKFFGISEVDANSNNSLVTVRRNGSSQNEDNKYKELCDIHVKNITSAGDGSLTVSRVFGTFNSTDFTLLAAPIIYLINGTVFFNLRIRGNYIIHESKRDFTIYTNSSNYFGNTPFVLYSSCCYVGIGEFPPINNMMFFYDKKQNGTSYFVLRNEGDYISNTQSIEITGQLSPLGEVLKYQS